MAAALCGLFAVGIVGIHVILDRQRSFDEAERNVANLADALTQHTLQTLAAIDQGLVGLTNELPPDRIGDPTFEAQFHRLLSERQKVATGVIAFFVLDEAGRLRHSSRTPAPEPVDLSMRSNFLAHRDATGPDLFIAEPILGRVGFAAGNWIVNVSRRLSDSDGAFAGVVAAAVSLDHFQTFYDSLNVGETGTVGLFRRDGTLIARSPFSESLVARSFADQPPFRADLPGRPDGSFIHRDADDGVERITAYRTVPGRSAVIYVATGVREALASWRERALIEAAAGGGLLLLLLLVVLRANRMLRRQQATENDHGRRLALLVSATAELIGRREMDSLLRRATELARELVPAHQAVTSLTERPGSAQTLHTVSLSEKYAQWRDWDEAPDGTGIYRLICENNSPMRLTQAELERHPAWRGFGAAADRHPPMRGWLAVPIVDGGGDNLGLIQLSDREQGGFTATDEALITQLAQMTSVAIGTIRLLAERSEAAEHAEAEQRAAEAARAEVEQILASISDAFFAVDAEWCLAYVNPEAVRLFERPREALLGRPLWEIFPEARDGALFHEGERARRENVPIEISGRLEPLDRWLEMRIFPFEHGLTVYFRDVTGRIDTEERLAQAQKMEALGQLTGGIAHDFNNLLTVVLGNAESLADDLEGNEAQHRSALMIRRAAERGAELTRHLLAFARRQALEPRQVDVNALVAGLEPLLRRTLGAHIDIVFVRGAGIWRALVDPAQLESAVLNLALNARDAMPEGGRLTVETANAHIDDDYAGMHEEVAAGRYVMVAVADTGTGMPRDVAAHAFEPFYTTKGPGKGSGLGLSMVYGFVKQTGGHVKIYSEPGDGTIVRLYLPMAPRDRGEAEPAAVTVPAMPSGDERILLVEDDDLVRDFTEAALRDLGYSVLSTADGDEAVRAVEGGAAFDLLLTDVVLPGGMNGRRVAERISELLPGVKVLFMSGYTENAVVHQGRLDADVQLLNKPFRRQDLARKLRSVFAAD